MRGQCGGLDVYKPALKIPKITVSVSHSRGRKWNQQSQGAQDGIDAHAVPFRSPQRNKNGGSMADHTGSVVINEAAGGAWVGDKGDHALNRVRLGHALISSPDASCEAQGSPVASILSWRDDCYICRSAADAKE